MKVLQLRPTLMPHQVDFVMDDITPIQGFVGGYRAGKTEALTWKALRCAVDLFPGKHGVIISPISGMNQRNVVPILRRILPKSGLNFDADRLSNTYVDYIDISIGSRTSRIWLNVSAENYTRMNGMSLAWGGFDEADLCRNSEIAYNAFVELGNRLSESPRALQFAVSTPEGFGFMYKRFVEEASEKTKITHVDMRDNFLLPPGYIESRIANIPVSKQPAYIKGEFCNIFTSTVYTDFDRELNGTRFSIKDMSPYADVHVGMDFNIDHCAAIVHGYEEKDLALAYPRAIAEHVDIKNVQVMISTLRAAYPRRTILVYPDASGNNRNYAGFDSAISLLRQAEGFKVILNHRGGTTSTDGKGSNPYVGDRIQSMNAMFHSAAGRRYLVNSSACPTYVKCLERQAWIDEKPDKSNNIDHPLDAGGYFIFNRYPVRGKAAIRSS